MNTGFQWNDVPCSGSYASICKFDSNCETGWTFGANTSSCYKAFQQWKTYYEARRECLAHNADLVSIESDEELDFVVSLVPQHSWIWIGAEFDSVDYVWKWVDKETSFDLQFIPDFSFGIINKQASISSDVAWYNGYHFI
ncbi:unnamed protein product, partial [Owenia fusiformis]